ncbi:MAG: DUF4157 domain-containing protein [Bradymonadales bacterium]|nr:DUF4157 domain-containing protein [Bradymonadales bacterium]
MPDLKLIPKAKMESGRTKATQDPTDYGVLQLKQDLAGKSAEEQQEKLTPPRPVVMAKPAVQYSPDQAIQRDQDGQKKAADVQSAAQEGFQGTASQLPHLGAIQRSFGQHNVAGVQAHLGNEARAASQAMGARAYTSGERIGFKANPDLHTAAHEAAHVVQQRHGVSLPGGVGSSGDAYEKHADAVADRVVQGKSAENLLSQAPAGPSGSTRAVQQKAPEVTVGQYVKFEIGVDIPIWGPIKAQIKAGGSYEISKNSKGEKVCKVECSLYGGVLVDLVIVQFTLGVEGAVKFEVEGTANPLEAIKKGIKEIVNWHNAKDFVPKMQQKKEEVNAAFTKTRSRCAQQLYKLGQRINSGDWKGDVQHRNWFMSIFQGSTVYDATIGPITDLDKDVRKIFEKYDATFDASKMIDLDSLKAMFDVLTVTKDQKVAKNQWVKIVNYVLNTLKQGNNDVITQMNSLTAVPNDPKVGFSASISIVAGAKVQITKDIGVEAQGKYTWSIEDELGPKQAGQKQWEHDVKTAFLLQLKASLYAFEVGISGEWKDKEFTLGLQAYGSWEYFNTDKATQTDSIKSLVKAIKAARTATPGGQSAGALKTTATCLMDLIKSNAASVPKKKFVGKGKGGVELSLKWKDGKLAEGELKFCLVEFSLDAENMFGGLVKGNVETGSYLALKWS